MCDCIKQVNKALAARNTALATSFAINFDTGKTDLVLTVPTKKLNSRGPKALVVQATFCPFCGEKRSQPAADDEAA